MALAVWNDCRSIDWQALPVLVELHGITDIDMLISDLFVIRDFQARANG